MPGGNLRLHMDSNKLNDTVFSEDQAIFFISNIILGLEYMHEKGFIHKDIKPENLYFDQNGYLKIADFGSC